MRVLIAPDKFKGTLTAEQAAAAIARGWTRARPGDRVTVLPISDGGDGFGRILGESIGGSAVRTKTVDAARRRMTAQWWWEGKSRTAVIESANIIGLARLPTGRFHPFELDTFGLGKVLLAMARKGARKCYVGIGGSATNDGGFGMAQAIGWRFLDRAGVEIDRWTALDRLAKIERPGNKLPLPRIIVAVDVQNRLLGTSGCTRVYGPQKGIRPEDYSVADAALKKLSQKIHVVTGANPAGQSGAGAAGGLGFGLVAFAGARLEPGFDLIAGRIGLLPCLGRADLVITGEGSLDHSSLMGKGVGVIAGHCQKMGIPCLGLAGRLADEARLQKRFHSVFGLKLVTSARRALTQAGASLELLAAQVAADWED